MWDECVAGLGDAGGSTENKRVLCVMCDWTRLSRVGGGASIEAMLAGAVVFGVELHSFFANIGAHAATSSR